ncbi:MAG: hypothetical protein U5L96_21850 [Owenweeksia sp.]|nr:hypothetical protein [Owenweeksia sp.]
MLRTEVESQETDFTESFTIDVNDLRNESASLVLRWAKTEVKVPMKVAVHEQAMANIDKALEEGPADKKWQVYRNAANYYYNNDLNLDQALAYMEQSIAAKSDSWYSHWLNAEILAKKSEYDAAIKSAQRALKAGEANAVKDGEEFSYANMIEESITEWKNKKKES